MPYKDPEARRAYIRAHYAANRERYREAGRAWVERNPERSRAIKQASAEARRATRRAHQRAFYESHRDLWADYYRATYVYLDGERMRIDALPEELRPVARLIQETRREIKRSAHRA